MSAIRERYMQQCIELAKEALENGNPPVGSLIIHDDVIIGKGIESGKTTGDITNHAEIEAVRDAIERGNQHLLSHSEMYTTHEPCIMCSYVIRHHRIAHIIYGASVDSIGGHTSQFNLMDTQSIPQWGPKPQVTPGILESECRALSMMFVRQMNAI